MCVLVKRELTTDDAGCVKGEEKRGAPVCEVWSGQWLELSGEGGVGGLCGIWETFKAIETPFLPSFCSTLVNCYSETVSGTWDGRGEGENKKREEKKMLRPSREDR